MTTVRGPVGDRAVLPRIAGLAAAIAFVAAGFSILELRAQERSPGGSSGAGAGASSAAATAATAAAAPGAPSRAAPAFDPALFAGFRYRLIGPSRGGRVTAVAGHRAQPSTFYFGSTGGGVWKSTDYGITWRSISDGYFQTGSIGAIRVAPSNPSVIYVGTGSDGMRSNVIIGKGVYKSSDAGETWTFVGLKEVGQIGAVEIHPTNPDIVFVAAIGDPFGKGPHRGVYRTRDGGRTWGKVLFVSDSVGSSDLELEPGNPDVIYAGMWRGERKPWSIISGAKAEAGVGIYKSTDGGNTWTRLTAGLPKGLIGKIDLAVSPANPRRIYALVETTDPDEGLYRSEHAGQTWRLASNQAGLMDRPFYYTNVDADPKNADIVYVNNEDFNKSTDGGATWQQIRVPHGDNHDMWINPDNPDVYIQSNDGGVNVTQNGGRTWSTQHNQPTSELYQVDVSDDLPYWACAGQQDNSTICVPSLPPTAGLPDDPAVWWRQVSGCETGPAVPKPGDPDIVYGNCKGRFGRYNHRTGQEQFYYVGAQNIYGHAPRDMKYRFQRVSPIEVSPHDPSIVYFGSQFVHRTTDDGKTWETISPDLSANDPRSQGPSGEPITRDITGEENYSVLYDLEESPVERGVIWVGANDGPFHVTRDNGRTWTNITPKDLGPGGRVQNIDASPHGAGKAYYAVYRYLLDDFQPYIYRTRDYGRTWTRLTDGRNGIPADCPTRVVREDPEREGLLYAGTECGIFISFDDGGSWQSLQQNFPATPVTDIQVKRGDLVISTMGRSFWVLDDVSPLRQLTDQVAASRAHLFAPREAYRMRYAVWGQGRGPRRPSDPEYLPPGAVINYWLGEAPAGEVKLEIVDAAGKVIRGFSSEAAGYEMAAVGQGMQGPSLARVPGPQLEKTRGLHRFIWDLRYPGPRASSGARRSGSGPLVAPGEYQVRLTAGDWSQTQALRVQVDPRIASDGVTVAHLQEQLDLSLELRDAIGEARHAADRIKAARQAAQAGGKQVDRRVAAIEAKLVTDPTISSYPQPMLLDQLEYVYGMIDNADQKPGRDAHDRFAELRKQLEGIVAELRTVLGGEMVGSP
ncbi:MAG: hypothetical protein HY704_09745 [Gemmatimonadetes bacterium]|nr:hypothetical protein [Gemmatimonadota bacterium]